MRLKLALLSYFFRWGERWYGAPAFVPHTRDYGRAGELEETLTFKTKGGEIYLQTEILDKIEAILETIPKERRFGIQGELGVYEIRSIPLSLVQKVREAVLRCTEYPGGITLEEVE